MINRKHLLPICLWCVVIVLAIFIVTQLFRTPNYLEVSFIDVGQGDAAFIRTSSDTRVILDAGGSIMGTSNVGRDVVGSFLIRRGILSIDKAIASHYHSDHARGIVELAEVVEFRRLLMPDVDYHNPLRRQLTETAHRIGADIHYISRGQDVILDHYTRFNVLWPFPDGQFEDNIAGPFFRGGNVNHNDDSLVMRLEYGNTSFLFTGDIESRAEFALLREPRINVDVLKVAHHGSRSSTTQDFLNAVAPLYAVIGVARNSQFGHPHSEVLDRLNSANITIYRTDLHGTVTFLVDRNGIFTIRTTR
ncbi:MAG: MBL fold metallo-hydrolase [Oscillospiraceae bacterium]|nr:MBL fold metallo-hydrolase [Oscillospiraceae bacterium]